MTTRRLACATVAAAALTLALVASACGSDSAAQRRAAGTATNTSAPTGAGTIPGAGDPGPGPTSLAGVDIRLDPIATVNTPVALVPRPGTDDLYVAQQGGTVRIIQVSRAVGGTTSAATRSTYRVDPSPVLDLSDSTKADGERGLLGIVFSADGQRLYADYTDHDGNTHVVEYPMSGDHADTSGERELMFQTQPFPNHNGGSLVLGPDGDLYIGFGDGGNSGDPYGNGQNTHTLLGKILRIDPNGGTGNQPYAIPDSNPFADATAGSPEVWLYGVRNPWRFSFDRDSGDLWVADVGQDQFEEVDLLRSTGGLDTGRGADLGWNLMEGTHSYQGGVAPGNAVVPVLDYPHDGGNCSVIGGFVYRGRAIPALQGTYLFGDYCVGEIRGLLQRNGTKLDERSLGATTGQGLTSFGEDNDGELYALDASGEILRIEPV
jgi:glucose/arabinose dehydrogenase